MAPALLDPDDFAGSNLQKTTSDLAMSLDSQVKPGFNKGAAYDLHRATYAADVVETLLENLRVSGKKNARVLDLAAGTGKFTEPLAARGEQYEVVAVEPVEAMRRVLDAKNLPKVAVKDGLASKIPVEEASVDAVVIAQVSVDVLDVAPEARDEMRSKVPKPDLRTIEEGTSGCPGDRHRTFPVNAEPSLQHTS